MSLNPLQVLFARQPSKNERAPNTVALWPSTDQWNDFGRKLRFDVIFNVGDFPSYRNTLQLAFLSEARSPPEVLDEVFGDRQGFLAKSRLPNFYTLLLSIQAYRDFVRHYGTTAGEILATINDLVAVSRQTKPGWYSKVRNDENFKYGIIRSNEAFFAFHNARDILDGLPAEGRSGFSERLELHCRLPNFASEHVLNFRFFSGEISPKRIVVMIGENGVGKTKLLSRIAKSLLKGERCLSDPANEDHRPQVSRLIALEAPRVGRSPFPARAGLSSPIKYSRFSLYRRDTLPGFGEAIVQLARSQESIAGESRMNLFLSIIGRVGNASDILIGSSPPGKLTSLAELAQAPSKSESSALAIYADVDPKGEPKWRSDQGVIDLSSGQGSLIKLAAQLCLFVERGTLILIDEPETHLHPAFIRLLVWMLDELLVRTGSAAIVATHSTYIVREVSREQVIILRRGADGTPRIERPTLRTLGADVGAISYFVFGDEINGVLVDKIEGRLSERGKARTTEIESISDDLAPEARAQLRRQ